MPRDLEIAMSRGPYLQPGPALALKIIAALLLGALIFWAGMSWARDRHRARAADLLVCEARLQAVIARNPVLTKGHLPRVDACANLAALVGQR